MDTQETIATEHTGLVTPFTEDHSFIIIGLAFIIMTGLAFGLALACTFVASFVA